MLHSHRLGQGLPINTIIIAAIGLIVLGILVFVVQNQVTKTSKGVKELSEATCAPTNQVKPVGEDCDVIYGRFTDVKAGFVCCKPKSYKS